MKKLVALPLVALFALACSEPTNPTATLDLSPSYAKKTPLPAPTQPTVCDTGPTCYDFEGIGASSDDIGISGQSIATSPNTTEHYLGVRSGTDTYVMNVGSGGAKTLTFNLYVIGQWLGDLKFTPAHVWQLTSSCGAGPAELLVNASFSNRLGNYQSFPEDVTVKGKGGHHGGLYAATGKDELGFNATSILYPTGAGDAADATYAIQRTIAACASATTITFKGKDIGADQMWGIDKITIE